MLDRNTTAERIAELEKTTLSLRTDATYWKGQHDHARRREEALKSQLTDTKARVRYLEGRLYGRQTERSRNGSEKSGEAHGQNRCRGGQPGSRGAPRRSYEELEVREETRDITEKEKHCPICGLPRKQLSEADHAERIEIEVKAHRRVIHRLKYVPGCRCEPGRGIITAAAVANLIPQSRYGISVWAHILLQKYHFQIPVASGTSYKAANWRHVGRTAGRGRNDPHKHAALPPKEIFLYPLIPDFRRSLQINTS